MELGELSEPPLCRDGADAQYLKQKPYNFTTNTLKAYLSTQASYLSAFVISKIHIVAQKPKCAVVKVPFFVFFFLCSDHLSNDDNSKTAQVLTVILARN